MAAASQPHGLGRSGMGGQSCQGDVPANEVSPLGQTVGCEKSTGGRGAYDPADRLSLAQVAPGCTELGSDSGALGNSCGPAVTFGVLGVRAMSVEHNQAF